ncbi:MAG: hypothetical protein FWH22_04390 [Fibromonadales bacterium]|nr:hypothetical protein [Fibromonadales bacterium]
MRLISAKFLLLLAMLLVFLFSCSRESKPPLWEPQSHRGSKNYNGGIFPVWIELKEPVEDAGIISWKTGSARIAYRKQAMDAKNLITADTAYLYWETPPKPFVKIDSVLIGEESWRVDSTYFYRDTVFAIVDGLESLPIIIEVKNILPRIKNITIEGVQRSGDSVLTIAAHPGDQLEITLLLEKSFNKAFFPIITMPEKMGNIKKEIEDDTLFVYKWTVPNSVITDSSSYLRIEDSGGYGEKLYKVHLIVYTEFGSVWAASEKDIVKYSPSGVEVARISNEFNSISDIAVNSNNGKLFIADQLGNSFAIYDTYGKQLYKSNDLFKSPTGVAIDVEGGHVWIADAEDELATVFEARLRRFALANDELRLTAVEYNMNGPIRGLSVNQFQRDLVWFAIPQSDTVGFIRDVATEIEPKFMPNVWNRPSMVSLDPINGIAWIADSSRIVAIDTTGNVLAEIKDFGFVSSVSASGGSVWASDILRGKVYRFKGPFRGNVIDLNMTVIDGMAVDGFLSPASVSAFVADGGAWVVDREAGKVVRLDSLGKAIAQGTGLKLPNLGKTLQKVE